MTRAFHVIKKVRTWLREHNYKVKKAKAFARCHVC
jgi:hypothetical protein